MKKAWELEYEVLKSSQPVILKEEEQTWNFADEVEKMEDIFTLMKWKSNVPGSGAPEKVIVGAVQAMENLGYDVSEVEKLIPFGLKALEEHDMQTLNKITCRIWNKLNNLVKDENSSYWNYHIYDNFNEYESKFNWPTYYDINIETKEFRDKIYRGWQAQICGGALGTAIEGYMTDNIFKVFGEVNDYVRTPNTYNDDITYEIAFLKAFEQSGYNVSSNEIAEEWVALVPFGWSAEEWALKNIKSGIYPPRSGYENNPYREWIGAQMRGAVCGMVAPGNPRLAAKLAFTDGVVSHFNNGVIGEIFNAIMVSLSFVETDIKTLLIKAINLIPNDSQYYSVIKFAFEKCQKNINWLDAWRYCEEEFKRYNWIHAYPNAAAEVIALWFGNGDFDETMHIIAMEGYDVDCNAAQIAAVLAILNNCIPPKWTQPIGDKLDTYIRGLKKTTITEITERTIQAIKNAR